MSIISGPAVRVYMVCVPPTASYGCEVWGHYKLTAATAASREALAKSHLHILRQISGVRSKTAVSILLAEFGLMCLPDQWLLREATFWNALAPCHLHPYTKRWLWIPPPGPRVCPTQLHVQGITFLPARATWFTLTSRSCLHTSGSAGMLSGKILTSALGPVLPGTPLCAHIETGLLGLQTAMLGHFWTCPCPRAACTASCASGWAATSYRGIQDACLACQDKTESV